VFIGVGDFEIGVYDRVVVFALSAALPNVGRFFS
jgi:hypothetical protein